MPKSPKSDGRVPPALNDNFRLFLSRIGIVLLVIGVYSNVLQNRQLHFDEENGIPRGEDWAVVVERDHVKGSLQWRPLATGALAIQGRSFGYDGKGYRATSIAFHAIDSLMILEVAKAWGLSNPVGIAAAVIFAVHPASTEPVDWLVAQSELLALMFILAALVLISPEHAGTSYLFPLIASSGAILCALMAKEQSAAAAGVAVLFGHVVPGLDRETRKRSLIAGGLWVLMVGVYLLLRLQTQGTLFTAGHGGFAANPVGGIPFYERWVSAGYILWHYAARLIVPYPLVSLYGYPDFTAVPILSAKGLAGIAALGALAGLLYGIWRKPHPAWIAPAGAMALLFPVSNLPIPIGAIFGDRLLYAPSAFFAMGLAYLLFETLPAHLGSDSLKQAVPVVFTCLIVAAYAATTYARNPEWSTSCRRFMTDLSHHPDSVQVLANAAGCAAEEGDLEQARRYADKSLKILPDFPEGLLISAKIYSASGMLDEAVPLWREAIASKHREMTKLGEKGQIDWVYFEYAQAMHDMGAPDRSKDAFRQWIEDGKLSPAAAVERIGLEEPRFGEAVTDYLYDYLSEYFHRSPDVLAATGVKWLLSENQTRSTAGEAMLREAVTADPKQVTALFYLGWIALVRGEKAEARSFLIQCLEADPANADCLKQSIILWIKTGCRSRAREAIAKLKAQGIDVENAAKIDAQGSDLGECIAGNAGEPTKAP